VSIERRKSLAQQLAEDTPWIKPEGKDTE
jgi:hypothetical protein